MKILMMTNTYLPFVGGVSRSVDAFTQQYRKLGHKVKIVAPTFEGQKEDPDVIRVPALQHFNGTEFSVQLPAPFFLSGFENTFQPDIIHSHHPFLLGNTALRLAARLEVPLIYTFHTFYEHYVHYLPVGEPEAMRRFVSTLETRYANLCDHVIAPSFSVLGELRLRGVTKPVDVIPTGVNVEALGKGDGKAFRKKHGVPADAFVVGFVSRLAPEKNLSFLQEAVLSFLSRNSKTWFLIAGAGPMEEDMNTRFAQSDMAGRIVLLGQQQGPDLADLYRAFDVFIFASKTETQGLVVTEAMAAGAPVVALQAPGVGDVVRDAVNGRLLNRENREDFVSALEWVLAQNPEARSVLRSNAVQTARGLSEEACARKALALYQNARQETKVLHEHQSAWDEFLRVFSAEWDLLVNLGMAAGDALAEPETEERAE